MYAETRSLSHLLFFIQIPNSLKWVFKISFRHCPFFGLIYTPLDKEYWDLYILSEKIIIGIPFPFEYTSVPDFL